MNLKHLTDKTLLADTKILITRERELLTRILHHLKEIDRRKLYSELGYASMFEYCVRELGYSEASAHRRIKSARLIEEIPEIEEKIENGTLNISNIAQASTFFNQHNVETTEDRNAILSQLENLTKSEAEKMLFVIAGGEPKDLPIIKRRQSEDSIRMSITFKEQTLKRCDLLKGLIGKNFTFEELIEYMVEICISEIEKRKFKVLSLPRDALSPVKASRVIKAGTKGEVYRRDQKCTKCGSVFALEYDHRLPFALGGTSDKTNLRLLCRNCNQRARIKSKLTSRSSW
jgi:hypothetical protein